MKRVSLFTAALAVLLGSVAAQAEKWVDYQPLSKTEIPALEVLKKHRIIDDYFVMVKVNSGDYARGNVMLGRHYTSFAAMSPEVQESPAIIAEVKQIMSQRASDKALETYDKYRLFDTDEVWVPVDFNAPRKAGTPKVDHAKR